MKRGGTRIKHPEQGGDALIRYRTGDVAALIRKPCQCGASTLVRIGSIPKRVALITEIGKQEKIYTSLFDEALYQIQGLVDYRIFLSRDNGKDAMHCKVEILGDGENISDRLSVIGGQVIGENIKERVTRQLLTIPPVRKSVETGLLAQPKVEIVERVCSEGAGEA